MPKIEELFAFVGCDDDGDEGLLAMYDGRVWVPLIGADMERIKSLRPRADEISVMTGRPYKLLKFKLVGTIEGDDHE